jgi:heat shock protein HslJ
MNTQLARASGTLVILGAVISGCTLTGGAPSDALNGTSWVLSDLEGTPALPGARVNATFSAGSVHGSSGCNSYAGQYVLSRDAIEVGGIQSTLMACEAPGLMEQEQRFVALLDSADGYRFDQAGLQLLRSGEIVLTFAWDG